MAKPATKPRPKPSTTEPPRWRRATVHVLLLTLFGGSVGGLVWSARRFIDRTAAATPKAPPQVVLANRPVWMSDFLAAEILSSIRPNRAQPAFDHELLVERVKMLEANPWVRKVRQVRRVHRDGPGDVLEIDCDWRSPVALVQWKDEFWLVDAEGVKLPERFTNEQLPQITRTPDRAMNLRVIEGVKQPPVGPGRKWPGDDLAAGVELAQVLYGKPYADEIERVNVANFGGRINPVEAQLTLVTRYNTELRWGRPVTAKDFFIEVPPAQKLSRIEAIKSRFGRCDAGAAYVDLRFDNVEVPATNTNVANGQ
jgi:hypothetical protein